MTYENKAFVPQTFKQIKKEYMETPFWLGKFMPGSQLTIVEDIPSTKPFRYVMKPSNKGGPAYPVNLIRISDGFVEKDLEISKTNTQMLLVNLPDNITNLKGVTLANDMGRWVFVSQTGGEYNENFMPKTSQIAASMEPAKEPEQTAVPKQLSDFGRQLSQAVVMNTSLGIPVDIKMLTKMADTIYPNRAIDLIMAARAEGWIYEKDGIFRGE